MTALPKRAPNTHVWTLGLCLFGLLAASPASAVVAPTWAVTGGLQAAGGGPVADGDYAISFSLYAADKGGVAVWTEPQSLQVIGGRFDAILGQIKPLADAKIADMKAVWLGVRVGIEPELPRRQLHAVAFASAAARADSLSCSGCVGSAQLALGSVAADKIGFPYAGAKTKGGPATVALDLQCTGCVGLNELKIDGDLDLGGNALKASKAVVTDIAAQTVQANSFVGDGSKLSGIAIPAGKCAAKGQVMQGFAADGSLLCVAAMDPALLPADGLEAVSNGVLSNRFLDVRASATTPKPIPDNNPTGMGDEIDFPDVGTAQKLLVHVKLTNSDIKTVAVELFDPTNTKFVLHAGSGSGKVLDSTWPVPTKTVSGDLGTPVMGRLKGACHETISRPWPTRAVVALGANVAASTIDANRTEAGQILRL